MIFGLPTLPTAFAAGVVAVAVCVKGSCASEPMSAASSTPIPTTLAHDLRVPESGVQASPLPGVFAVQDGHEFGYVSADGRFLLRGDLFDLATGRDLTEDARRADRLAAVATIGPGNAIEFAPKVPGATKSIVTVFTDVDCGYCRRFHSQIRDYNARGIAVRYLAWPRSGPSTASWKRAETVWCAKDRAAALSAAKRGESLPAGQCDSPVAREYQLGVELGVHGTPTMILPNGELLAGYLPPDELEAKLAAASDGATRPERNASAPSAD